MRRPVRATVLLLLLVICVVPGCGYHPLTSTVVHEASAVKSIHIPLFINRSYRATLEAFLANSITEQFARRRGEWRIAGEGADYLLSGVIIAYELVPVAYNYGKNHPGSNNPETVAEYRATITAELTLKKSGARELAWKRRLTLSQNFPANSVIAIQQNSEDAAIQEVCRKLAQDIQVGLADDF
jgi:outer membrane lipopolysaccharide assembly protein LptE/RlpB